MDTGHRNTGSRRRPATKPCFCCPADIGEVVTKPSDREVAFEAFVAYIRNGSQPQGTLTGGEPYTFAFIESDIPRARVLPTERISFFASLSDTGQFIKWSDGENFEFERMKAGHSKRFICHRHRKIYHLLLLRHIFRMQDFYEGYTMERRQYDMAVHQRMRELCEWSFLNVRAREIRSGQDFVAPQELDRLRLYRPAT